MRLHGVDFTILSDRPRQVFSPDSFATPSVPALLTHGDTVEINGDNIHESSFIGRIVLASWSSHIPRLNGQYHHVNRHPMSCTGDEDERLFLVQLFITKPKDSHPNQWIDLCIGDKEACSGITHAAETSCFLWVPIRLVSRVVFLLPIIDFTKQKYGPLYFRRNTYVITSRARFSWDNNLNCWGSAHFSTIDDAPYLTFGANTTATRVVPYTMCLLHALQAESELDKKLTTNNVEHLQLLSPCMQCP